MHSAFTPQSARQPIGRIGVASNGATGWSTSGSSRISGAEDEMRASDIEVVGQASQGSSDSEDRPQVYLSVCWATGKLGAAYYDASSCQIHLLSDVADASPDFLTLQTLIKMAVPRTVIASQRQDERFVTALKQAVQGLKSPESIDSKSEVSDDIIAFVPNVLFDIGASKSLIINHLNFSGMPQFHNATDRVIYLSSLIDFNNVATVRSLGALLKYLDRKRVNVELEQLDVKTPIVSMSLISLRDLMLMNDHTYGALQIFQKEWHPSVYKLASGTKEGLSLFGMFNQCKSVVGSREMMSMFLRPTKSADVLSQRHAAINFFLHPGNTEIVTTLQGYLKHIKNVASIFGKMKGGHINITEWQSVHKTAFQSVLISDVCKAQPMTIDIFSNIVETFTPDLLEIAALITRTIDFDESIAQSRFVVNHGVDQELDEKKRTYNGLPDFLTTVARSELDRLNLDINECSVIYLPQLGYLLAIPMTETWRLTGDYTLGNCDYVFISNDVVYFKSDSTRALDLELGDIQNNILDHETSIQLHLQNAVIEKSAVLNDVLKYCAQLDCLIAMAKVAKEFNYVQPLMTEDDVMEILDGRHPLQEFCVSSFIPNSMVSGGGHSKVKLLTGPNASGKSVYLKQVALITFMAHIGSFVPASSARICFMDGIYSRVRTVESVSSGMSTFMLDLNQVDGMALLASTINYFLSNGMDCPHLLITTHIFGVLQYLPHSHRQLTYQTMETVDDKGELVYLFRLTEGQASNSFAAHCAEHAGIPKNITDRVIQVTNAICEAKQIPMNNNKFDSFHKSALDEVEEFLSLDQDSLESSQKFLKKVAFEDDHLDESVVLNEYRPSNNESSHADG